MVDKTTFHEFKCVFAVNREFCYSRTFAGTLIIKPLTTNHYLGTHLRDSAARHGNVSAGDVG